MTKKQIAKAYIDAANKCIIKGKKDNKERFLTRLRKNELDCGVCKFIENKLKIKREIKSIYNRKNFKECWGTIYWTNPPICCYTKKDMLEALDWRIKVLKTWL